MLELHVLKLQRHYQQCRYLRKKKTSSSRTPSKTNPGLSGPPSFPGLSGLSGPPSLSGPQVSQVSQVSQKTIEKLVNQNAKIMSKLDQVISGQKSLNDRMIKLEKVPDVQNDEELIKVKTLVIYILFKYYAILRLLCKLTQYSN